MFMEDQIDVLVELLTDFLGKYHQHYESRGQISFDCPVCAEEKGLDGGDGKGNLEINYGRHVYKCWSCGETHGTHGPLGKLFDQYATKEQKKIYNLIKPEELKKQEFKLNRLRLPEGFVTFKESNPRFIPHAEAYRYLMSRGITDEMIEKYNIGYTVNGDFAYRIIIPSYDKNGELNYFIGRSWVNKRMKYKNPPSVPKDQIIFNEKLIDWNQDVYLVEGAFDSFFLPNPLVMLGKKMSTLILETLYNNANGNIIICLDEDAWDDAFTLYHTLNGGRLYNKIKIIKPPKNMDVADLRGQIESYFVEIK